LQQKLGFREGDGCLIIGHGALLVSVLQIADEFVSNEPYSKDTVSREMNF